MEIPKFGNLMKNVTVTVGRDAVLTCVVESLSTYKVRELNAMYTYIFLRSVR